MTDLEVFHVRTPLSPSTTVHIIFGGILPSTEEFRRLRELVNFLERCILDTRQEDDVKAARESRNAKIFQRAAENKTVRDIAEEFGLTEMAVYKILEPVKYRTKKRPELDT